MGPLSNLDLRLHAGEKPFESASLEDQEMIKNLPEKWIEYIYVYIY